MSTTILHIQPMRISNMKMIRERLLRHQRYSFPLITFQISFCWTPFQLISDEQFSSSKFAYQRKKNSERRLLLRERRSFPWKMGSVSGRTSSSANLWAGEVEKSKSEKTSKKSLYRPDSITTRGSRGKSNFFEFISSIRLLWAIYVSYVTLNTHCGDWYLLFWEKFLSIFMTAW